MIEVYLFDWGDTLMVDFPGTPGKMCDWETVAAVDGAREALEHLSGQADIYVASAAAQSTPTDIEKALERVGLDGFIKGYYCPANLGVSKGQPEFLPSIIERLGVAASRIAMGGDSLAKDIEPAARAGVQAIWLTESDASGSPPGTRIIASLRELCA